MNAALLLLVVAWCITLEYRLREARKLIFGPDDEDIDVEESARLVAGAPHGVAAGGDWLESHRESAPVPGQASDEREARELAIQRGVETLIAVAREQGVSMTEAEAREHAALMLADVGL